MYEYQEIDDLIKFLFNFSKNLKEFKDNPQKFLDIIKNLDWDYVSSLRDYYSNGEKVRELRYFILNKIYNKEELSLEEIKHKMEQIEEKYPDKNVFRVFSKMFYVFFELFYKQFKDDVKEKLTRLHYLLRKILEKELKVNFNQQKSIKPFDWNSGFGTPGCWLALIPYNEADHKNCAQLFISINYDYDEDKKVHFGLYYGDNLGIEADEEKERERFRDIKDLDVSKIIQKFKAVFPTYVEVNKEIVKAKTEGRGEILIEFHKEGIDFSELEKTFDEFPLYFDNIALLKNQILACLKSNKNIIFFGPPGTGKTKLAEIICQVISKSNNNVHDYIFTTATADWTTFETIGGYMPEKESQKLTFRNGLFLKCFRDNNGDPINRWLVIDEINRADIDKAFGQLFSVLSGNKVDLPYFTDDGEEISIEPVKIDNFIVDSERWKENVFYVTNIWRLLATMNTYDKASLYEMSYAFMRRFAFIHIDVPKVKRGLIEKIISIANWNIDIEKIKDSINKIEDVWEILNKYRKIGPAIIYDILQFSEQHPDREQAFIHSIIQFILPQFEGLEEDIIKECFSKVEIYFSEDSKIILNKAIEDILDVKIAIKKEKETRQL